MWTYILVALQIVLLTSCSPDAIQPGEGELRFGSPRGLTESGDVTGLRLSPSGSRLAVSRRGGHILIRDLQSGSHADIAFPADRVRPVGWTEAEDELLLALRDVEWSAVLLTIPADLSDLEAEPLKYQQVMGPDRFYASGFAPDGGEVCGTISNAAELDQGIGGEFGVWNRENDTWQAMASPWPDTRIDEVVYPTNGGAWFFYARGVSGTSYQGYARRSDEQFEILRTEESAFVGWGPLDDTAYVVTRSSLDAEVSLRFLSADRNGELQRLGQIPNTPNLSVVPSGRRLVFRTIQHKSAAFIGRRDEEGRWSFDRRIDAETSMSYPRMRPGGGGFALVRSTPDGHELLVVPEQGEPRLLFRSRFRLQWPAWSGDGSRIFVLEGTPPKLTCVRAEDGVPVDAPQLRPTSYLYSDELGRLRFQTNEDGNSRYHIFDTVSGIVTEVGSEERGSLFQSAASPDGRFLAVAGNRGQVRHVRPWRIGLTGGPEVLLADVHAAPVGWSDDGETVFLVTEVPSGDPPHWTRGRVLAVPADGRSKPEVWAELPRGNVDYWADVEVSGDGNTMVCVVIEMVHDAWTAEGEWVPLAEEAEAER